MDLSITLRDATGTDLNARVDISDQGIILHSRSGKDRNRDYRQAMELLFERLDAAGIEYDIFNDSQRVQDIPMEQRKLTFPRGGLVPERFNALIRSMNDGTSSHGAWKRILIATAGQSALSLKAAIESPKPNLSQTVNRLPASDLRQVTPDHIDTAVARLLSGEKAANFDLSRDFDLIAVNGERLAPKKVFGLALEEALGIEAMPGHFTAGIGTPCFQLLEGAGYPIVRKDEPIPGNGVEPVDPDLAIAEGQPKLVAHIKRERKPALAEAKRRAMIAKLGHLQCERCELIPSHKLGKHGDSVIEVHHAKTLVSDMADGHVTRLSDLMCLCANCHRIVHRELAAQAA